MSSVGELFGIALMSIVKTVVTLYTYLTLPYYYYTCEPWKRLIRAKKVRSKLENASDPKSAWVSVEEPVDHPLIKSTVTELIESMHKYHGRETRILGFREVLYEEISVDSNGNVKKVDGRVLKKVKLTDYKWLTYGKVEHITRSLAKGLAANGVSFGDKVLILSETRVEWLLSCLALTRLGACTVTLFPNLGNDGMVYGINHTQIKLVIASRESLQNLRPLLPQTPTIQTIVYFEDINNYSNSTSQIIGFPKELRVLSYRDIKRIGKSRRDVPPKKRPKPDDLAIIVFTSGTTGIPKPVMVSHRNLMDGAQGYLVLNKDRLPEVYDHTYMAFLPLAHILELTMELALVMIGCKIGYSSPLTMSDSGQGLTRDQICDLRLLRPTVITTVPLVLDRLIKEIYDKLTARSKLLVETFNYLMEYKSEWTARGYDTPIINALLCRRVSDRLGGKLQYICVGGAPLNPRTQRIIKAALNIKLLQGYGATESMAGSVSMDFDDLSYGRIGSPMYGCKIKLEDWTEGGYRQSDKPNPRGEILIGGDRITPGYYNLPEEDRDAFYVDSDGVRWFRTGDIGERYSDGTFKIIDRRKDLIKLSNGKFVALGSIEAALKNCQYVEDICVCGGNYSNNLVAIIAPNHKNLMRLGSELCLKEFDMDNLCEDGRVVSTVYEELKKSGQSAGVANKEMPVKIKLVSDEWTTDNDMLTAALKLKRQSVLKRYKYVIDSLIKSCDE